jgi:hypothetical protein
LTRFSLFVILDIQHCAVCALPAKNLLFLLKVTG